MNALEISIPSGTPSVTFTREIDAPPDVVFATMMDADLLPQWWGPAYLSTRVVTHQPVTGGSWRYVQTDPEGNEYGFHGVFHEITPGVRAVQTFEFEGMPGHVTLDTLNFEDLGGRTRLHGQSAFQSLEDRDGMVAQGMEVGMAEGYDRLEALILTRA